MKGRVSSYILGMNRGDLWWFYLLWRTITYSVFIRVDFGLINNIKFSLKLMQIEITSTLPSVGWMWNYICTHLNSNLILLFIHPYPLSKGWVNTYFLTQQYDFREKNDWKNFSGKKVFIRPWSHKSDPYGNTDGTIYHI